MSTVVERCYNSPKQGIKWCNDHLSLCFWNLKPAMSIDKFVNVISVITQHTIYENTLTSRRGSRKLITLMKSYLNKRYLCKWLATWETIRESIFSKYFACISSIILCAEEHWIKFNKTVIHFNNQEQRESSFAINSLLRLCFHSELSGVVLHSGFKPFYVITAVKGWFHVKKKCLQISCEPQKTVFDM